MRDEKTVLWEESGGPVFVRREVPGHLSSPAEPVSPNIYRAPLVV